MPNTFAIDSKVITGILSTDRSKMAPIELFELSVDFFFVALVFVLFGAGASASPLLVSGSEFILAFLLSFRHFFFLSAVSGFISIP